MNENKNLKSGSLEALVERPEKNSAGRAALVDTFGNISYSLAVGAAIDYSVGLNLSGIVASRATGTAINSVTGGPYGWYREKVFNFVGAEEESRSVVGSLREAYNETVKDFSNFKSFKTPTTILGRKMRKNFADLLAFNTFQVPLYAAIVAFSSFVSEGNVDFEKVQDGAEYLAKLSILIGPTLGLYVDGCRKVFGVKSAAEGAYSKK